MSITVEQLAAEARRLSALLDRGIDALRDNATQLADAEHAYRLAVAKAWTSAPEGTVPERHAWVDGECAGLRRARDVADGMRVAALEAVRSRRQQLSAVQSVAAAARSEMEMARYGPETTP